MDDLIKSIDDLVREFENNGGNSYFLVDGQEYRTDTGYAMEGITLFAEKLKERVSQKTEQQNARIFQEIIVEYPSISTYPECEGKPYFSIKYMEDGQSYIGYGTYKPEVLSEYLKKDFILSAEPRWIPCSKKLPEEEYVLISKRPTKISGSKFSVAIAIRTADPRSRKIQWRDSGFGIIQDDKVLAWMSLPEAYKEDGEAE